MNTELESGSVVRRESVFARVTSGIRRVYFGGNPGVAPAALELSASPAASAAVVGVNRMAGLDVLRFVAVSLVIFRHGYWLRDSAAWPRWLQNIGHGLQFGGWVGVDIFFVLSGFLVSGLLFQEWKRRNTVSVGRFLLRRAFKIYPSFWFFLAIVSIVSILSASPVYGQQPFTVRRLLCELFFVQNFVDCLCYHTWSLAVEEHFYLLLAGVSWLLLRLRKDPKRSPFESFPGLFALVACACLVLRIENNALFPAWKINEVFFASYIRMDSLFFGVLLSYLWHFRFTPEHHRFFERWRSGFILAGIGLLLPMFFADPFQKNTTWMRVYGFILCYLGAGALLIGSLKLFNAGKSRVVRILAFLGANSYPVYLWHWKGINLGAALFGTAALNEGLTLGPWLLNCLLAQTFAWTVGITAARLVEAPMLRLRDRWFPSLTSKAQPNEGVPLSAATVPI